MKNIGKGKKSGEVRWGVEFRRFEIEDQVNSTIYNLESWELLAKLGGAVASGYFKPNTWALTGNFFYGIGKFDYYFLKPNEGRKSNGSENDDLWNYNPRGYDFSLELYFTVLGQEALASLGHRRYTSEIKIVYLPDPDGSKSTGSFKEFENTFLGIGLKF
tara:strand:+ start:160 stop:639 length:480 start_codon:yes stop_codon:yes gene_type:complete